MSFSPEPTAVRFDDAQMWVELEDGRTLGIPLVWFPRLLHGTVKQREDFFLSPDGIHWDDGADAQAQALQATYRGHER